MQEEATGRLRPGPGGSGGWCITPGQDVLDRIGLLLYRRELLGKALDSVAEQPRLKACLFDVLHLFQVEPEMALLDHHGGHRLPEGRRAKSVAVRSSCINPGSVLPSCTCLSALAWWTCRIAMACIAEVAWQRERLSAYRLWTGDADGSSKRRCSVGTGAPRSLSTPWPPRRRG